MIELIDFVPANHGAFIRGYVTLKYYDLLMKCRLRVYRFKREKDNFVYIEMPCMVSGNKQMHVCHWPSKIASDTFQKEALAQLKEKFPEAFNLEKCEKIEKIVPGKARNSSRFAAKSSYK